MAFTTTQLAAQINNSRNDLQIWANSTLQNQGPMVPTFTTYFNNLQAWITQKGTVAFNLDLRPANGYPLFFTFFFIVMTQVTRKLVQWVLG